ncbi:helix-turn-helix domain-containing protein [Xanthobacter sediminis]|uniref:helix-turn-helix domain-containing protein n=1 Tax=Xanthobacter sediminis TaxID=3119926 RepID=UPI00372B3A80
MKGCSGSVALVRARGFGDLPEFMERQAGERTLAGIFGKAGLPLAIRDDPMMPLPLPSMMSVFEHAASALDNRTFGLEVGERMTHRGYGLWVDYSMGAKTLGEALRRLVATSWAHQNGGRMELAEDDGHKVLRFCSPATALSRIQHSDHMLAPMRAFMRLYLGPRWNPAWAEVDYTRDAGAGAVEDRLQAALRCGRPGSGIAVGMDDLDRRRGDSHAVPRSDRVITLRDVLADVILANAPEPARAISAVVALRLLDGRSDIEGAAAFVGLSVQGLQRRLREKGYTYREIVGAARCARAVRLLVETRMSVLSIALSLGYETHAAFTRAFIRRMGCTPLEYRRRGGDVIV